MDPGSPALSVVIHGHFYQPPREDPWVESVPRQPSAAPFHDWNERVDRECYGPVTAARILRSEGRTRRTLNCLEFMSFNFGPTLLTWMEKEAPDTYRAVLDADRRSIGRTGHGGALAMPYHHSILPLSDRRDKVTEVRWGIEDFTARFGRAPEGMWLPETAVDEETLDVLALEGIQFTVLAPHQVDPLPPGGQPGVYVTPSGAEIVVFPYDGPRSHDVAYGDALRDAELWTADLMSPGAGIAMTLIAIDGETFGHHKKFGEMALARTLEQLEDSDQVSLSNLSQYLADHPPVQTVEIVSPTSWSCAHGVGRWEGDCGCKADPSKPTQQEWRGALRKAMTWLAGELHQIFQEDGQRVFAHPWQVRDDYGAVVGTWDRERRDTWTASRMTPKALEAGDIGRATQLLEMERNALRLFTSCAWFFDDLARVEPIQVLKYAARAVELASAVSGRDLEPGFLSLLDEAPSNDPEAGTARDLYLEHGRALA